MVIHFQELAQGQDETEMEDRHGGCKNAHVDAATQLLQYEHRRGVIKHRIAEQRHVCKGIRDLLLAHAVGQRGHEKGQEVQRSEDQSSRRNHTVVL